MKVSSLRSGTLLLGSFWLLCSPAPSPGQTGVGEVNGSVSDRSGGVLPGVIVRLTNVATEVADQTQTNSSGYFVFINVRPGGYILDVEAQGFKKAEVPQFTIDVNQTLTQNLTLELGSISDVVTVNAEAPLLQDNTSELGTVISGEVIKDLPLNGRNFTQLLITTPGANPISTAQGSGGVGFQDAGITGIPNTAFFKVSLHGQQNRSVLYYLDGIVNTDFRGSIYGVLPIIDTVDEFKVESHSAKTQFGGVTGGVVDLVSRSGTNSIHGSGWEFIRNNAFDARNPFTGPAASYHQNEFGAAAGGPVIRNKTFFYVGYEGWRYNKSTQNLTLLPTTAELNGDFSQSFYNQPIFNPFTTVCNGTSCTRAPFDGNKIPDSMISKPMQAFLKSYLSVPNGTSLVGTNNLETRPQVNTSNSWQIRIDHHISDRQSVFGRLSQMWVSDIQPVNGTNERTPSDYHAYNFGGGWDYVLRPNVIFDVRAGALLKPYTFNQAASSSGSAPATSAGFKNVEQYGGMVVNLSSPYTSSPNSTSVVDIGQRGLSERGNPGVNWDASVNWIKATHNIRAGAQFIYVNRLQNNLFQSYGFSDSQTSNLGAAKTGNSLASALLGLPNSYTGQLPQYAQVFFRFTVWSGYVQDEWKIKPSLTLTMGLRYDYLPKIVPLNNRLSNSLDLFRSKWLIGASSVGGCLTPFVDPCIPGGLSAVPFNDHIVLTGQQSAGPPAIGDNIGPRVGLAWRFLNSTVLRGGYGVYYDTVSARSQYAQNTIEGSAWPWTTGIGSQPANIPINGVWPGATGNPLMPITSIEGNFPNPVVAPSPWTASGFTNDPAFKNARAQEWNIEVQRQFPRSMVVSVAYVGSKNTRLDYTGKANAAPHPNPQGTPAATVDAEKLMPFMVPSWNYSQSIGYGNYNALEVRFDKRFAAGLSTLVSYTWSKSLDVSSGWFGAENGDGGGSVIQNYFTPNLNYGQSAYNVPQLLVWSTVYDLPFGRNGRWLKNGPLAWVFGNWETNYVFLARSGKPYNLVVNGDIANITGNGSTLSGYGRPDVVGDPNSACTIRGALVPAGTEACFYNPAAFAVPSFSFGNSGRDILRTEPFYNIDFSLLKNIPLGEARALQLRFEGFNVFNFQILGTPGNTIGLSSAGVVTSVASTPRQLQLAAKFTF